MTWFTFLGRWQGDFSWKMTGWIFLEDDRVTILGRWCGYFSLKMTWSFFSEVQFGALIACWIFSKFVASMNSQRHPIAHPHGWAMGCLLWVQCLVHVICLSLYCCIQLLWAHKRHPIAHSHRWAMGWLLSVQWSRFYVCHCIAVFNIVL